MISTAPMRSSATWSSNSIESARTSSRGRVLMASEASMRGQDSEAGPRPDGCHRHATGRRDPVSPPLDTDSVPVAGCPFVAAHRPALDARARRRHVAQPAQVPEPLRGTACPFRLPVPREFRPRRRATPRFSHGSKRDASRYMRPVQNAVGDTGHRRSRTGECCRPASSSRKCVCCSEAD